MQDGKLLYDSQQGRYIVRIEPDAYSAGRDIDLHCGNCLSVFTGAGWVDTRLECQDDGAGWRGWRLVGMGSADSYIGWPARI